MALNLIYLHELCKAKEDLILKLQEWGLIPKQGEYKCYKCNGDLKLWRDNDRADNYRWCCNNDFRRYPKSKLEKCKTRIELRKGTFFEKSKLSIFQILGFVHLWVDNVTLKVIANQVGMDESTAVQWSSFCREVVFDAFIVQKEKLGGPGKIVEIDESKFGRRKYHRGHRVEGQWVFGGYERGTGKVFMICVEDRGAETLLPIIKDWIYEGTTIISDYWKAYDCLQNEGFVHLKVNHSINFKDPETGAHSNAIESSWRAAKGSMSSSGRRKAHIPGNLARYMFQKNCIAQGKNRTLEFYRLAGTLYPGFKEEVEEEVDVALESYDTDSDFD